MTTAAELAVWATAAANGLAALVGAGCWWFWRPARVFWVLARTGQALGVVLAVVAGLLALRGFEPADGLFWLYALLPVAVAFVAEQVRVLAAQTVLDARGIEDAQAVGRLPRADQEEVVLAILRRELGVIAVSAGVVAFLALRALAEI